MHAAAETFDQLLRLRADDAAAGVASADGEVTWTWAQYVAQCASRAAYLEQQRRPGRELHVGVLLANTPGYLAWLGAAALAGATVVGVNPTRRGAELARDVRHTDISLLVTDGRHREVLDGLDPMADLGVAGLVDEDQLQLAPAPLPTASPEPDRTLLLTFTSGSTGAPKAVRCSTGRLARIAQFGGLGLQRDDVCYSSMPLFHGNAIMALFAPALAVGAGVVLRDRFSASRFLPDVLSSGATYFTYVGRTIAYILAQPERAEERQTRLRQGFGTEASARDRAEFSRRYGCPLVESYGSSEGGISIRRTPTTPPAALGPAPDGMPVAILDPQTGRECPPARFDAAGRLLNEEAIGELVALEGAAAFEGYYANEAATAERLRGTQYWSGDLGYRDAQGWFYFAGRAGDRLRIDGENFAAAPADEVLSGFPGAALALLYAVPDARTGDAAMVTLVMQQGVAFDVDAFHAWVTGRRDLHTKAVPRYLRLADDLPVTATGKVDKPALRRAGWHVADPVWVADPPGSAYRLLDDAGRAAIAAEFERHGRAHLLPG